MDRLVSFVRWIFEEKGIVDDREPIYTFHLKDLNVGSSSSWIVDDSEFGVFLPRTLPWIQLVVLVLIQSIIQCTFATIIYTFIVRQRGTIGSYIVGWGIIIPLALYIPFVLLEHLDIRNKVLGLATSTVMTVVVFRCLEAMYGTTPSKDVIESSMGTYCVYHSSVAPFVWTPKGRQTLSIPEILSSLMSIGSYFLAVSLVLSIMVHYKYKPFQGDDVKLTSLTFDATNFSLSHLGNSYCQAILVYLTLKTGFDLTAFEQHMKGYATDTIFDSPFLKSRSPTEFWTRRWNLMIQRFLKGGIFLPIKQHWNAKIAMFITFVVSGLYHEYVWECIFYNQNYLHDKHGNCYQPGCYVNEFGRVTAFFTYVGFIMVLERPIGRIPIVRWLDQILPAPIVAHFLILLHLPVAQWYIGDWIEGGYFDDFSICTFLIRKL